MDGFLQLLALDCSSQVSSAGEPTSLDQLKVFDWRVAVAFINALISDGNLRSGYSVRAALRGGDNAVHAEHHAGYLASRRGYWQ